MSDLIAKAYEAVKGEGDPIFENVAATFKSDLAARADGVDRTGIVNTPFEVKYKELKETEAKEAFENGEVGALGTLPAEVVAETEGDETVKETAKTEESDGEPSLNDLKRAELDEIAVKEFGFNPSDYSNKQEIKAAIEDARNG